jgi:N-acetylneuraminic acid mutarotase
VVLYNVTKNEWKQLKPLPYEVSIMATVRWENNIVVLGGHDKNGKRLNTVILYNVKTGQSHTLPAMGSKRLGCSAVVIGSKIVVTGGMDAQGPVKSVEAFNFRSYSWEELPEMSVARWFHTAAVV